MQTISITIDKDLDLYFYHFMFKQRLFEDFLIKDVVYITVLFCKVSQNLCNLTPLIFPIALLPTSRPYIIKLTHYIAHTSSLVSHSVSAKMFSKSTDLT